MQCQLSIKVSLFKLLKCCYDCLYQFDVAPSKYRSDFTNCTCMPPHPVSRTSIILLHVLQGKHWISTCTLSENVFLNCLISWCVFFSHTWVQEKDVIFFYSLVFLFNQKGKWSIGTRCNILFFFKPNFPPCLELQSFLSVFWCCKRISYVLHVQFCKSHKKWTIDFCLKQEQKKTYKERNVLPVCSINSIAFILFTKSQSYFHFHVL